MTETNPPTYDHASFLANFAGMEDLASEAVGAFLTTLPALILPVEQAISSQNAKALEISAHTLKGVLSNFQAGPARDLAWHLEQIGRGLRTDDPAPVFAVLRSQLNLLCIDLSSAFLPGSTPAQKEGA